MSEDLNMTASSSSVLEMEEIRPPVDLKEVINAMKMSGMTPIKKTHVDARDESVSRGRARQLEGSNVVLYLRNCPEASGDLGGMCNISEEAYEKLAEVAESWIANFAQRGAYGSSEKKLPSDTILHLVTPSDTIQGLAIKYDTTVARLRQLNSLPQGRDLFERKEFIVPVGGGSGSGVRYTPNPSFTEFRRLARQVATGEFQRRVKCTEDEARCYLEFNDFCISKAESEFNEDSSWVFDGTNSPNNVSLSEFVARRTRNTTQQLVI